MIPFSCIEEYLSDQSGGMRGLTTWFQNLVTQTGAPNRPDARRASVPIRGSIIGTAPRIVPS